MSDRQEPENQEKESSGIQLEKTPEQSGEQAAVKEEAVSEDLENKKPEGDAGVKTVETKSSDEMGAASAQVAAPAEAATETVYPCAAVFRACAAAGPLLLFVVLAALVWGAFWKAGHGVYCPPESAFVTALLHCMDLNSWLAPIALVDGVWNGAQWPLFYWVAWLLSQIPHIESSGLLLSALSTVAAAFILLAIWSLALAAGFGRQAALAAGLIIIAAPFFIPVAHFVGPMPMAAALMLLSLAFFARGWRRHRAWLSLPLAFILAALSGLCGGPVYLAIPLAASFFFLIWLGRFRRAHSWDAVFGFALMLILAGGWLLWVTLAGSDNAYLTALFSKNIVFEWPPAPNWWRALLIGFCGILPWTLLVFTVSWGRVFRNMPQSIKASRKDNASALIWISIALVCLASPFMPLPPDAGLPLIFLVAVMLGRAFVNLTPMGNRAFFLLAGIFVTAVGIVLLAVGVPASRTWFIALLPFSLPAFVMQALDALPNLYLLGILIFVCGLGIFFLFARRYRQNGGLLYGAIVAIAITQFAVFMLAPDLATLKSGPLYNLEEIRARVANAGVTMPQQTGTPEQKESESGAKEPVTEQAPEQPAVTPKSPATPAQEVNQQPETTESHETEGEASLPSRTGEADSEKEDGTAVEARPAPLPELAAPPEPGDSARP